jgi:hypothetical protein
VRFCHIPSVETGSALSSTAQEKGDFSLVETVNAKTMDGSETQFLKVLLAEEDDVEAFLLQCELNKVDGLVSRRRAANRPHYLKLLKEFRPNLVIADYHFAGIHLFIETRELAPGARQIALLPKREDTIIASLREAGVDLCVLRDNYTALRRFLSAPVGQAPVFFEFRNRTTPLEPAGSAAFPEVEHFAVSRMFDPVLRWVTKPSKAIAAWTARFNS